MVSVGNGVVLAVGGSNQQAKPMPSPPLPDFFVPGRGVSPYLAAWNQAFAALDPARSQTVELWFDRGPRRPVVETARLPLHPDARSRELCALYLSALVNNILCTSGARRVSVWSDTAGAAEETVAALETKFLLRPDGFSDMSLRFLHGLIHRHFGESFAIDADRDHALALRNRFQNADPAPAGPRAPVGPGTVLAVNIGQHLTRLALVHLDGRGGHAVTSLTQRDTREGADPLCFFSVWERILAEAGQVAATAGGPVDALAVSLAATTVADVVIPVSGFGLFAASSPEACDNATAVLRQACGRAFPGLPLTLVNDGAAQALFAFHYGRTATGPDDAAEGDMLSLRLGACPAVHRLDGHGNPIDGLHEYGWLVTRYAPNPATGRLFATIRLYLSHYGVAVVAHELGLLQKYRLHHEAAIPFFHDALVAGDHPAGRDAARIYGVLGAHLAMLARECDRRRPLGSITLLGSRANRIDAPAFAAMANGFTAFAHRYDLPLDGVRLDLIEESSVIAGLVGAAHAALARESGPAAA